MVSTINLGAVREREREREREIHFNKIKSGIINVAKNTQI